MLKSFPPAKVSYKGWRAGIIIAHGGVGSSKKFSDGPAKAVRMAQRVLRQKSRHKALGCLDAAVVGAVVLEDDPRFNAGTGSNLRIDAQTIEMDAAIMDSDGHFGAVAGIQRVKNPIKVTRLLINSPHTLLCGNGATWFARLKGFPDYNPETPRARKPYQQNSVYGVKYYAILSSIHQTDSRGTKKNK